MMVAEEEFPGFEVSRPSQQRPVTTKAWNKRRDSQGVHKEFRRHYFENDAVYNESNFERRFCMPLTVSEQLMNTICGSGVFQLRKDGLEDSGISPLVLVIAALRIRAYGKFFDIVDEICEMPASSARESFHGFVEEVLLCFSAEYLRAPNDKNLKRILGINAIWGFPGCFGSWDGQH